MILGRTLEELSALMAAVGQPAYRAKQLRDGVLQVSLACLNLKAVRSMNVRQLYPAGTRWNDRQASCCRLC